MRQRPIRLYRRIPAPAGSQISARKLPGLSQNVVTRGTARIDAKKRWKDCKRRHRDRPGSRVNPTRAVTGPAMSGWRPVRNREAGRRALLIPTIKRGHPAANRRQNRESVPEPIAGTEGPGAVRIVAGRFRGRQLASPRSQAIRPTTDRVRESLFNVLSSRFPGLLQECRVLDLFAGTGALGIEALSRGASSCVFVEDSVEGRGLLRANIESSGLQGITKILRRDATKLGAAGTIIPFDLVFADPPYGKGLGEKALLAASTGGWLKMGSICVVEEDALAEFGPIEGFTMADERRYGDTTIRILVHEPG